MLTFLFAVLHDLHAVEFFFIGDTAIDDRGTNMRDDGPGANGGNVGLSCWLILASGFAK